MRFLFFRKSCLWNENGNEVVFEDFSSLTAWTKFLMNVEEKIKGGLNFFNT